MEKRLSLDYSNGKKVSFISLSTDFDELLFHMTTDHDRIILRSETKNHNDVCLNIKDFLDTFEKILSFINENELNIVLIIWNDIKNGLVIQILNKDIASDHINIQPERMYVFHNKKDFPYRVVSKIEEIILYLSAMVTNNISNQTILLENLEFVREKLLPIIKNSLFRKKKVKQ